MTAYQHNSYYDGCYNDENLYLVSKVWYCRVLKFISRILLYMYMTVGVAIMPTGQQLYSPTGFLPVPMSSPSGYAAGEYPNKAALSSLSMGCVYSIWSGVCKLDYGAVC